MLLMPGQVIVCDVWQTCIHSCMLLCADAVLAGCVHALSPRELSTPPPSCALLMQWAHVVCISHLRCRSLYACWWMYTVRLTSTWQTTRNSGTSRIVLRRSCLLLKTSSTNAGVRHSVYNHPSMQVRSADSFIYHHRAYLRCTHEDAGPLPAGGFTTTT
jgi:hypothetical protein